MKKNFHFRLNLSIPGNFKQNLFRFNVVMMAGLVSAQLTAQSRIINGPAGTERFGTSVTVLSNGNYVVTDPYFDNAAGTDVGAVFLYNGKTNELISATTGSTVNDKVGLSGVVSLPNGNFIIHSPKWNNGAATSAGAVTWINGTTGLNASVSSSNSLTGSVTNDQAGSIPAIVLTNGNYVVTCETCDNGNIADAGAIAWGSGTTGVSGIISNSNSLTGSSANDKIGFRITPLKNGNFLINSPNWKNGTETAAGAVTWVNGNTGITGEINSSNSLVGTKTFDRVGIDVPKELTNGNYVVGSHDWALPTGEVVGAVTWCNGTTGRTGEINTANSLTGTSSEDKVGSGGITPLSNGNYAVSSPFWNNGAITHAGAVTWADGTTGITGSVTTGNSLTGSTEFDEVGSNGVVALTNGNYVVVSIYWNNGLIPATGAVTWGNGATGITGPVSASNSLVGSTGNENIGSGKVTALTNGNYVVASPRWDNGATADAGAVTWCNGTTGRAGPVASNNSLTGISGSDFVGSIPVTTLSNGNYVINSPYWDNGPVTNAGAVTWGDGSTGITGTVTAGNSLVGSTADDNAGSGGIVALTNGNYVVASPNWDNGGTTNAGAVTHCDGTAGKTGEITSGNSLTGAYAGDFVGEVNISGQPNIYPLPNGNYVIISPEWSYILTKDAGAITWASGTAGITGDITPENSLIGGNTGDFFADFLSDRAITVYNNSHYIIKAGKWNNNNGSFTLGNGSAGVAGVVSGCNSVLGSSGSSSGINSDYNLLHDVMITGQPDENQISIFDPHTTVLGKNLDNTDITIHGLNRVPLSLLSDNGCRIIASLLPNGASPARGDISAHLWIENGVPIHDGKPYVARHYQLRLFAEGPPGNNIEQTATARITLYFTQQEFTDYNNHPASTVKLPVNPTDQPGIANLKVIKYSGASFDFSGLPATYPGPSIIINPDDGDIKWNAAEDRWEVSFDVTGFSGFFVQAIQPSTPLTLIQFSAAVKANDILTVWKTADESETNYFEVERSTDGKNFVPAGRVTATGSGNHIYSFTDVSAVNIYASFEKIYYRLKSADKNSVIKYSAIVPVYLKTAAKDFITSVQPLPFTDHISISLNSEKNSIVKWIITDNTGRRLQSGQFSASAGLSTQVISNLHRLPSGSYFIRLENTAGETVTKKVIKQ